MSRASVTSADTSEECVYCKPTAKEPKESSSSAGSIRLTVNHDPEHVGDNVKEHVVDIYRDTPVRLLGYANEVGESFRALVPVTVVRLSYLIAAGYVVADTADKSLKVARRDWPTSGEMRRATLATATDTLVWQTLASVLVPGVTINRVCAGSLLVLARLAPRWPSAARKWLTTGVGLACIPFIVHPIDRGCDWLLDNTIRPFLLPDLRDEAPVHLQDDVGNKMA